MIRISLKRILTSVMAALVSLPAFAIDLPGPVVDVHWLANNRDQVQILDTRSGLYAWSTEPEWKGEGEARELVYSGGHIDGALGLDYDGMRVDRTQNGKTIKSVLPDAADVENLFRSAGLRKGKPVVVTSLGDTVGDMDSATRIYWTLKHFGASEVAVLDGGNASWLQAGFPVSVAKHEPPAAGDWTAREGDEKVLAELADVEQALKRNEQTIDARPLAQYLGVYKKSSAAAAGHLAGAKNYPPDTRYRAQGVAQHFLKPDEYSKVLGSLGIDPVAPTITYCNSGHMASSMWFIQSEILGTDAVRLYDGSMYEWTQLGKPVVGLD